MPPRVVTWPAYWRDEERVAQIAANGEWKSASSAESVGTLNERERRYYPEAAWMNLGSLNGGRLDPLHADTLRPYLDTVAEFPLEQAYPILAWVIENSVRRLAATAQARSTLVPLFEATLLGAELAYRLTARSSAGLRDIKRRAQVVKLDDAAALVIQAGERSKAVEFIRDWVERAVHDYLKICDPYFNTDDLEAIRMIVAVKPGCRITVLTSRKEQSRVEQPWPETYQACWRLEVSDQEPPDLEVVVAGFEANGESPIHDRWWLTNGSGLRFGTSYKSLGVGKVSEISIMSPVEADERERRVDEYVVDRKRIQGKDRIRYVSFSM